MQNFLRIYLNDHYAGATVGLELAKRTLANNKDTQFEKPLKNLCEDIEEDRYRLEQLMENLGIPRNPIKESAGWLTEKLGRLKFNGQIRGYSDLSRLIELEGLSLGVEGKLSLWKNLKVIAEREDRIELTWLDNQQHRAEEQREALEKLRLQAAGELARSVPASSV